MTQKEQVVIVGFGWVGQANALALRQMGYPVAYFDPGEPTRHYETAGYSYAGLQRLGSVRECDSKETCYIVCVGDRVSEEGVQDVSLIRTALDSLKGSEGSVVLRSTIIPDTLESLLFDFYVPEFLHEKLAVEECLSPFFFVVGARTEKKEPTFFKVWRSRTGLSFKGTPREAALIKYLSNLWNAMRIAFVNEFGDVIAAPSSKEEIYSIERVINFVLRGDPYLRYGRSFGGHCLPKDTRAFIGWYGAQGKNVELLKGAYRSNVNHQSIEKKHPVIPEWFSEWPFPHISGIVAFKELIFSIRKNLANPREVFRRRVLRKRI